MSAHVLFHIDLNAFFASAEELRHPEYKDMPIAVGSLSKRGVLSTANYAARACGVHSAMPTRQALHICPDLIVIPGDYEYYRSISRRFFDYLRRYSPQLEILSVDECFLDVTETIQKYRRPLDLAVQIQQGLKSELGLSCSIGVAPTRFLAKMASDMHKPNGITVLRKSEIKTKLWPLPVDDIVGIGKKTVPFLHQAGIQTIGDLADPANTAAAQKILGRQYLSVMSQIKGTSSGILSYSTTRKSVSHSRTFQRDLYSLDEVLDEASGLIRELCLKMQRAQKKGAQISITLRDIDFHNQVRSAPLPGYTNEFPVIFAAAGSLFTEFFEPVGYRLIGVTIGSLQDEDKIIVQPSLFEPALSSTEDVVKTLNRSLEGNLLMKASDLLTKSDPQKKHETPAAETDSVQASFSDQKQQSQIKEGKV